MRQALRVCALRLGIRCAMLHMVGDDIARLHKSGVAAGGILHGALAQADEFVDVELVVGKQHKVLEMLRIGSAVMAQPLQRVIHARRGKQRQWLRRAGRQLQRAVGDAVVHGVQIGPVKADLHALALRRCQLAFVVCGGVERKVQGNGLLAGADLQTQIGVGQQQCKLLAVIVGKQIGCGERGLMNARPGHKTVRTVYLTAWHSGCRMAVHPHLRIKGTCFLRQITFLNKTRQGMAQMRDGLLINRLRLCQSRIGIGKALRGDIGRCVVMRVRHVLLPVVCRTL